LHRDESLAYNGYIVFLGEEIEDLYYEAVGAVFDRNDVAVYGAVAHSLKNCLEVNISLDIFMSKDLESCLSGVNVSVRGQFKKQALQLMLGNSDAPMASEIYLRKWEPCLHPSAINDNRQSTKLFSSKRSITARLECRIFEEVVPK